MPIPYYPFKLPAGTGRTFQGEEMSHTVRQAFPEEHDDQDRFVLDTLRKRKGKVSYNKLNSRFELLNEFDVRKRDFDKLCIAINRLEEANKLRKSEEVVRKKETFVGSGYCNPASRRVTIMLITAVPERSPSPFLVG